MQYRLLKDLKQGDLVSVDLGKDVVEEVKEYKRWRAEKDKKYSYIDSDGEINDSYEDLDAVDDNRYAIGNYYETEKLAQLALDKALALQELRDLAEGYEFNINNIVNNYYISYVVLAGNYNIWEDQNWFSSGKVYFETREKAQHAIDVLGKEKLNLIFGIK